MSFLDRLPDFDELTLEEIAHAHRFKSVETVRNWCREGYPFRGGTLPMNAYKVGGEWRIPRDRWLEILRQTNPEVLRQIAEQQDEERKQRRREEKRLRKLVG